MLNLEAMRNVNPITVSPDELVDISDVNVDKSLSK